MNYIHHFFNSDINDLTIIIYTDLYRDICVWIYIRRQRMVSSRRCFACSIVSSWYIFDGQYSFFRTNPRRALQISYIRWRISRAYMRHCTCTIPRLAYYYDIIGEWKHPEERHSIFHSLAEFPITVTASLYAGEYAVSQRKWTLEEMMLW